NRPRPLPLTRPTRAILAALKCAPERIQLVALALGRFAVQPLGLADMLGRLIDRTKQRLNRATAMVVELITPRAHKLDVGVTPRSTFVLVNRATRRQHQTKRTRARPRHTSPPTRLPISLNRLNQLIPANIRDHLPGRSLNTRQTRIVDNLSLSRHHIRVVIERHRRLRRRGLLLHVGLNCDRVRHIQRPLQRRLNPLTRRRINDRRPKVVRDTSLGAHVLVEVRTQTDSRTTKLRCQRLNNVDHSLIRHTSQTAPHRTYTRYEKRTKTRLRRIMRLHIRIVRHPRRRHRKPPARQPAAAHSTTPRSPSQPSGPHSVYGPPRAAYAPPRCT